MPGTIIRMPLDRKMQLEAEGFTVYEKYHERSGRTLTYVHHPENRLDDPCRGLDNPWFGTLMDIDHYVVDNGEYLDLDIYAWPVYDCPVGQGYTSANDIWQHQGSLQYDANGQLVIDPLTWGLIISAIILATAVLITCIARLLQVIADPCGQTSWVDINDCWKVIRGPDCQKSEFNACGGPDANGDGVPDGQWAGAAPGESGTPNWTGGWPDWFDPGKIIMWVAIAAVAIGGVYLAVKLIPMIGKKGGQPQYYQPPPQYQQQQYQQPQYREAPGIDYVR